MGAWMNLRQSLLRALTRHRDIKLCILFGSRAAGRGSSDSDPDIAIVMEKPLPAERYLKFSEEFSSETNRGIDLMDLMTATGPILKQALSTGIIIQNRNRSLYARLISRMLFNQSDMMPLYYRNLGER